MLVPPGNFEIRAMLNHEGIDESDITILPHTWNIEDLISGRVDAASCYSTDIPYVLTKRGIPYTILQPINYGIDFYGDCLYTTEREIREHPARARAFLAASLRGWQYAMEHQNEIIEIIINRYGCRLSRDTLRFEAEKMRELMLPKFIQIGHMNPGRWQHIADTFVQLGMLTPGYSLKGFIYNPDEKSYQPYLKTALIGLAAMVLLIGSISLLLFAFNRKLKKSVQEQTAELTLSEQRFREIFNSTSDALIVHDPPTGALRDVNETMLKMFGYERKEALTLQVADISEGVPPYSQAEMKMWLSRALSEGPQIFEWHARQKDGRLFWVEVSLQKSTIAGEDSVLASVRNITDRRRLEAELRQAQKMEAIGTLAGGIAHDFNNILTAIFGYTELAKIRAGKDPVLLEHLELVRQGAIRARDLVRQILAFSRKAEQSKQPLRLAGIIGEVMRLLRSTIPASIEIHQEIRSDALIFADPSQMHQVILNLCTNGYQAMEDNKGRLTIALDEVEIGKEGTPVGSTLQAGSYVRLMVSDTGCGMDEKTILKIFEPYFTTKEQGKGTGLGLAVVHGIVTRCGGEIVVESEPGRGTCFILYLPVFEPSATSDNTTGAEQPLSAGDERIMFVDDEQSIRDLAGAFLGQSGYHVETFADGEAAWEQLTRDPLGWDLLISDLNMPGMNGLELARKVRKLRPDLPVILCTGYSEEMNESEARKQLGIALYLQKPLTSRELLQAVGSVLQKDADSLH